MEFINPNIGQQFLYEISGKNLKTFFDSMDFNDEELRYIKKITTIVSTINYSTVLK